MINELNHHGYDISAGTLYPIFHNLENSGLLIVTSENVNVKIRKYYTATEEGVAVLQEAKEKIKELTSEL